MDRLSGERVWPDDMKHIGKIAELAEHSTNELFLIDIQAGQRLPLGPVRTKSRPMVKTAVG